MDFFSPGHLVVIAIVAVVVLVGWKKLPEMTRSFGRSLRIFKSEMRSLDDDVRVSVTTENDAADGHRYATIDRTDSAR